ncbi:NAD(P)H-hydrate dehydratase [Jatrophihabitans sp. YIM 134969]
MTEVVSPAVLRGWPLPGGGGSKHARGHVVVVGGSAATPGAALLAGLAALRMGAGVLALAVPEAVAIPLAVALPEAMVQPLGAATPELVGDATAVLIGPGFDAPGSTRTALETVLPHVPDTARLVLDAFALGVLPDVARLIEPFAGRLVLTPNDSEAARLLDVDDAPDDAAVRLAERYGAAVSHSGTIASPDGTVRAVDTGHAGLGTSGSGDVLAGAVVGVAARGAEPDQAACWATYAHAAAGDRLAARVGRLGFLARELLDELPVILTELES